MLHPVLDRNLSSNSQPTLDHIWQVIQRSLPPHPLWKWVGEGVDQFFCGKPTFFDPVDVESPLLHLSSRLFPLLHWGLKYFFLAKNIIHPLTHPPQKGGGGGGDL